MASLQGRLRTDPTVMEGGTIVVDVPDGVNEVHFVIPGRGSTSVAVVEGRAEFPLPPSVAGGTTVLVTDGLYPNPNSTRVQVVGGQSR